MTPPYQPSIAPNYSTMRIKEGYIPVSTQNVLPWQWLTTLNNTHHWLEWPFMDWVRFLPEGHCIGRGHFGQPHNLDAWVSKWVAFGSVVFVFTSQSRPLSSILDDLLFTWQSHFSLWCLDFQYCVHLILHSPYYEWLYNSREQHHFCPHHSTLHHTPSTTIILLLVTPTGSSRCTFTALHTGTYHF